MGNESAITAEEKKKTNFGKDSTLGACAQTTALTGTRNTQHPPSHQSKSKQLPTKWLCAYDTPAIRQQAPLLKLARIMLKSDRSSGSSYSLGVKCSLQAFRFEHLVPSWQHSEKR